MASPKGLIARAGSVPLPLGAKRVTLALSSLLSSCAGGEAPEMELLGADPARMPAQTSFDLTLLGRGFGLSEVRVDLSDGAGARAAPPLVVILVGRGAREVRVPSRAVTVESPTRLRLAVRLERPPAPGVYGARVLRGGEGVAEADRLFEVVPRETPDAGPADAGPPDAGAPEAEDAGAPDAGPRDADPSDAGERDLATADAGPADAGAPFFGSYAYRQPLDVDLDAPAPAGVTLRVGIPHAALVDRGRSRPDAADLVVYQGSVPLAFQWEDAQRIGTNDLVMVVRLNAPLPARPPPGALVLYYGDPGAQNAPSDAVYLFSQRFDAPVAPEARGDPQAWFRAQSWSHCALERGRDAPLPMGAPPGAYCAVDAIPSGLVRQTLSTPVIGGAAPLPPGQVLEMRVWLAGRTVDGDADILYFSHGPDNEQFDRTTEVPPAAWAGLGPTARLRFRDIDGDPRTVDGWRFPRDQIAWWREAVARFTVAETGGRSLHFRHVSTDDDTSDASFAAIDDWTIRVALDPEPRVTLGPVEVR